MRRASQVYLRVFLVAKLRYKSKYPAVCPAKTFGRNLIFLIPDLRYATDFLCVILLMIAQCTYSLKSYRINPMILSMYKTIRY